MLNSHSEINRIDETRGNSTVEAGDFLIIESNFDSQSRNHHSQEPIWHQVIEYKCDSCRKFTKGQLINNVSLQFHVTSFLLSALMRVFSTFCFWWVVFDELQATSFYQIPKSVTFLKTSCSRNIVNYLISLKLGIKCHQILINQSPLLKVGSMFKLSETMLFNLVSGTSSTLKIGKRIWQI